VTDGDRVVVEQILSGHGVGPSEYLQPHDEWVTVLAGGAQLEVGDEVIELAPGDWVVLPADVPHRVVQVEPNTSWLAVHL
jgi:cupin 2 domain-containing protein